MTIRILLQTTLPATEPDDWTIDRFSMLTEYLKSLRDEQGAPLCQVTARDKTPDANGSDPVLSTLSRDRFDELWLFALDVGDGLTAAECRAITRFHAQGGGILATRDHQDMGLSMCDLPTVGGFHYFHTAQPDPDPDRLAPDDIQTSTITWPNYHSGANGDYQTIIPTEPVHPLLIDQDRNGRVIERFPAHPHEGGVGIPAGNLHHARVVARGKSIVTGREFNLVVAAERVEHNGHQLGRLIAQSTFHHFVDYNLDTTKGCPTFVDEPPGRQVLDQPDGLRDIYAYFKNALYWLKPADIAPSQP
jgi:hypothetical protein